MNRNHDFNTFFLAFHAARALIAHPRCQFAANWRRDLATGLVFFNCLRP